MKERPILFNAINVLSILDVLKTQTRRVWKLPKDYAWSDFEQGLIVWDGNGCQYGIDELICPYGRIGDRLWVKETWRPKVAHSCTDTCDCDDVVVTYAADGVMVCFHGDDSMADWEMPKAAAKGNVSPLFMPRWASRILLEITNVRAERLMSISKEDAIAEGCSGGHGSIPNYGYSAQPQEHYFWLWDQINGEGSYKANPWVWVVEFKVVEIKR